MSVPIPLADPLTVPARGACGEEDDSFVATIPIRGPATTVNSLPASETTAAETPAAIRSDVDLLSAFVLRREPEALTLIVERYGPMVYRVALRVVDERHLAEDIFQATFLVLAQSARKIRHGELLPAWLHGTARNIARRALADRHAEQKQLAQLASQSRSEKGGEMSTSTELDPFEELARRNEQQLLDEELQQLPEASRTPLVLFYLEEKSQSEIAQLMGLSVDAVEGRLRRARQELRQRLIRRGVFLSTVVAAATVLAPSLAIAAPATTLVSSTVATALGTTAVGGTLASTTLATGATTAAKLAAQEVAAMSAASKATAILLTTVASTTVATGLLFGAIVGSLTLGDGRDVPAMSVAEMAYPLNLIREGDDPDPFSLESDQPILLAQVELPATVFTPEVTDESDGRIRMTRQYDVTDFDAELRKKFVDFYKLGKSVTFRDNLMKIRALEEDHWLYEMALDHYREKRDQGKLSESEFDSVLSTLRKEYAKAPDAALQNLKTAEKELADRELTHGRADAGTRDLQRRVDLWRAVSNAVRNAAKPSDAPMPTANTPRPEAKPVVYQIADLDIDHKWIALEYARTLDVHVASHESTQSFVVRTNDQVHQQITEFIGNLRTEVYAKNTESVRRQLTQKLKTHSDNHPALEQLRHLLAQLQRVQNEHEELQAAAMNNDPFALHRKLSFFVAVANDKPVGDGGELQAEETVGSKTDEKENSPQAPNGLDRKPQSYAPLTPIKDGNLTIDNPETVVPLRVGDIVDLNFKYDLAVIDVRDPKYFDFTQITRTKVRVEAKFSGAVTMEVTGIAGEKSQIRFQIEPAQIAGITQISASDTMVWMTVGDHRVLKFPDRVKTVEGFKADYLSVIPKSPEQLRVEAEAVGETTMAVTGENGESYQVRVQILNANDFDTIMVAETRVKHLEEQLGRLNQLIQSQKEQLDEFQKRAEIPDGQITQIDQATGTVWLNRGQKTGLRTQVTFSVYDSKNQAIAHDPEQVKAKIEVVEIRETSAIARIVEEDRDRPIEVGDVIFSPLWTAGQTEHFAFVGNGDLNNDGEMDLKDRKILKDLLAPAGAEIDVEITDSGERLPAEGKLTAQTNWLIVGELGDPSAAVNDAVKLTQLLAMQKQHEMLVQEARDHGIKIVPLKDFLTYMGWKPEVRLSVPGAEIPFKLMPGAHNTGPNPLAQAPAVPPEPVPDSDEMSRILADWEKSNSGNTSLQSKFARFEFDTVFETETRSTGTFHLDRPNRWRYDFEPADQAMMSVSTGRTNLKGDPFKVLPGTASKWICTGQSIYILNVSDKSYDTLSVPPGMRENISTPRHVSFLAGDPLSFLFSATAEDVKRLFSLKYGRFHNPHGDTVNANGKPLRKAIHLLASPNDAPLTKYCSEVDVILDPGTFHPLNLRIIDPSGTKETIYSFDQSETKVDVKWGLKIPFRDPLMPGWKKRETKRWPLIDPPGPNDFLDMLYSDREIDPPLQTEALASVAKAVLITQPFTEIELPVHDIRLLKFPVLIARAEIQYEPVLEVKPLRGHADFLHLRAITDGSCLLIVTGTNDAVYRVGIKAGVQPRNRFREIDANEAKAANALETQVSMEFPDNSLKEVCNFITQLHNLPVVLDEEDIKASGASPDLHVTMKASGLTLAEAMRTMLEKVKEPPLDYYIDGGAIHISTVAAMKTKERLLYYRLACLSPEGQATAEKYITPLATSVAPLEGDLLIDASVDIHKKFAEYLEGAWRLESQRPARAIDLSEREVRAPRD